jgi:hypothetical protein
MELLGDMGHVESRFGPFGDRCTVCAKHTLGSEIALDALMVPLDYKAQLEARFGPFGDSANIDAR